MVFLLLTFVITLFSFNIHCKKSQSDYKKLKRFKGPKPLIVRLFCRTKEDPWKTLYASRGGKHGKGIRTDELSMEG